MATLEAAYWVGIAVFTTATIATVALVLLNQYATNITVAARRGRLEILATMTAMYLVILMKYVAFLLGQGFYTRADTVDAHYAYWIAYGLACTGLVYIVTKWLWHMKLFVGFGMVLTLLGHTLLVFGALSNTPVHWAWYGLSFLFFIPLTLVVIFMRRRSASPYMVLFAIVAVLLVFAVYPVITGLGHAFGAVISLEAETWVYFVLDIITKIILPFVLFFTYLPVPCGLMERDELDCQAYKGMKTCERKTCGNCCTKPSLMQRAFSWTQDVTLHDGTETGVLPCNAIRKSGYPNQQGYAPHTGVASQIPATGAYAAPGAPSGAGGAAQQRLSPIGVNLTSLIDIEAQDKRS